MRVFWLLIFLLAGPTNAESSKVLAHPGTLESLRREGCELTQKKTALETQL